VFYDRIRELVNPIDPTRLDLDAVHGCKDVVMKFYRRKKDQCDALLEELDKMCSERTVQFKLKAQLIDQVGQN
jgi:hypothetical protein